MIKEEDLQLLEMHLDGEMTPAESAALQKRLDADAELAGELARLKGDRQVRTALWASMEGDENAGEAVLGKVKAKVARRNWFHLILDNRERIAAAAACIAVFLIGWQWGRNAGSYRMINTGMPSAQPVRLITQQQLPMGQTSVFEVRVTDGSGNLLRLERFKTLQEAQAFIEKTKVELGEGKK